MNDAVIRFIGGGNMATSLIGGLAADGYAPQRIHVSDPVAERRDHLEQHFGIKTHTDNRTACAEADVLVLAVKPQQLREICLEIRDTLSHRAPLILSIAAGISTLSIGQWLGQDLPIVRAMPNTPAMIQSGATGLFANVHCNDEQRNLAESILRAVGMTLWVEEERLIDAVTAVSGSGPAYFFLLMEIMETTAGKLGLEPSAARLLTLQTALGAARMALESDNAPSELRRRVTSPGGTTQQALQVLEDGKFPELMERAIEAACARAASLSRELGDA